MCLPFQSFAGSKGGGNYFFTPSIHLYNLSVAISGFCTTEDLFTQSFVIPYIIPMLENAGAIVYTPPVNVTGSAMK